MLKRFSSPQDFLDAVKNAPVTVDQWQLEKLALVLQTKQAVFLTPGVAAEYHSTMWGPVYASPAEAIAKLLEGLPANAQVAVIPEGPYVLARVEDAVAA